MFAEGYSKIINMVLLRGHEFFKFVDLGKIVELVMSLIINNNGMLKQVNLGFKGIIC